MLPHRSEVHICVDDQSTVYVNGHNVGETTQDQWQVNGLQLQQLPFGIPFWLSPVYAHSACMSPCLLQDSEMFSFDESCTAPTTYAIDGVDNAGVSAIIANFNRKRPRDLL